MSRTFILSDEEFEKFSKWASTMPSSETTIGEQFEFRFLPTGIGTFASVKCLNTGEVLELTDPSNF